ncbi:MAG: ATP-binding protein [Candidatus Omnitrophota bacterium]
MFKKIKNSLRLKSIFWLCVILFGIFAVLAFTEIVSQNAMLWQQQKKSAHAISGVVLTAMRNPMLNGDQDIIQRQFEYYKELEGIESIHLLDQNYIIKRSTDITALGKSARSAIISQAIHQKALSGVETENNRKVFTEVTPVFNEKRCYICHGDQLQVLGVLKVASDWEAVLGEINTSRNKTILLAFAGIAAILLFVIMFLLKTIILPIQKLSEGMVQVSVGKLGQSIPVKGSDEIAQLTRMFNKMARDISSLMAKEKALLIAEQGEKEKLGFFNKALINQISERKMIESQLQTHYQNIQRQQKAIVSLSTDPMLFEADLKQSIQKAVEVAANTLGVERASVWLMDAAKTQLRCFDLFIQSANQHQEEEPLRVKDYPRYFDALETLRVIDAHDSFSDPRINEFTEIYLKPLKIPSLLDSQIRVHGELVGVVCLEHVGENPRQWHSEEIAFSGEIADHLAQLIVIQERKYSIKRLKQYFEKLEAINKELDDFTYIISHDLKEPLRSIDSFSGFLLEDYQDKLGKEGKHYLERIIVNVGTMQRLIDNLLAISSIEHKDNPFVFVDSGRIIDKARDRLEYIIKETKAEINICEGLPEITCDNVRVEEVFYNLILNAINFSDKNKPVVEIGGRKNDQVYEFYVKDNGPGIEEKYFEKIFGIFQRIGDKKDVEGTGAGLAIVKKIVEIHRGKIWVESVPGQGAVFYFTIPVNVDKLTKRKRLGEILIEKNLVTEGDVYAALEEQEGVVE